MFKKLLALCFAAVLSFQVSCFAEAQYDDDVVFPIGVAIALDDNDVVRYEYDQERVALQEVDGKVVPVVKKEGDTIIVVYIKQDGQEIPIRMLVHATTMERYRLIVDDEGNLKPKYKNDIYGKKDNSASKARESSENEKANISKQAPAAAASEDAAAYAQEVLELVNKERAEVGAQPLSLAADLQASTAVRAGELLKRFSHTRPDGSSCFTVMSSKGRAWAENIAAGQTTAAEVMDAWMHSPGHKANILNPKFRELGVGLVVDASSDYKYYWVQLFRG